MTVSDLCIAENQVSKLLSFVSQSGFESHEISERPTSVVAEGAISVSRQVPENRGHIQPRHRRPDPTGTFNSRSAPATPP